MTDSYVVIDASLAIKSVTPGPVQKTCIQLLTSLSQYEITVPSLFLYETTSVLSKLVHFEVLTAEEGKQLIALMADIGASIVIPDQALSRAAYDWTISLGRASAYDSYYLALAESLTCEFWTADRRLFNLVDAPWIRWFEQSI